jgi:hypothetical protein
VSRITTTAHDLARQSRRAQGLPDIVEDQMALIRVAALVRLAQAALTRVNGHETAPAG